MIDVKKLMDAKRVVVEKKTITVTNDFIKRFRSDHGLTQVVLSNILGVTKKTVEKWEQGKNPICGSSALLLTLLDEDPALFSKVYSKRIIVGNSDAESYQSIREQFSKKIDEPLTAIDEPVFSFIYTEKGGAYCGQY